MKKFILTAFIILFVTCLHSCKKPVPETNYVTINESLNAGTTYSLDLSKYAGRDARVAISTQAKHFTVSQIVRDRTTGLYFYQFSIDSKQQENEQVVIELSKDGRCNHDSKTIVTVNFTVLQ